MAETGIGALLARLRDDLGWSQQRVADEYNKIEGRSAMTGKEIGRYERESRVPTSRTLGFLATVFGIDQVALDRAAGVSRRRKTASRSIGLPKQQATVPAAPSRRVLAADATSSARFSRFLASRNTDPYAVEQLDAEVFTLARQYVSRPVSELHDTISSLRDETFDLLRGRQRPRQTLDLYAAAGRLCGLSAHVCLDLGDYASAMTHSRTAWACAEEADHHGLRAWVRGMQSLITFWDGDPREAADLARAGQSYPAAGADVVRLASLEARALAAAGDRQGASAALRRAEHARDALSDDAAPGIFSFPHPKQLTYAGTTHLSIGDRSNVQQAINSAAAAIDLYRDAAADDRSTGDLLAAHLDLARGHMLAGHMDATEGMLTFVLDSPGGLLSASILRRLSALSGELGAQQYRGSPRVAELRERIHSTTTSTASPPHEAPEPLT
ncbi:MULTISPECIES: helix-turn-helix domain-containing protein [Streptomyces]|uniref:XRE family transcriptional regulator n=2 Tax=Streptomyces TaxID=1883 RepID=A0A3Q9FVC0_STRLT|nr:helix-turn-helix transcriptional regulator [Streptomyces luteoverticillatus]AZQ72601.1 XRE family transcriptional regulator [Streptomyces luteoverticillatus]